MCRNSFFLFFVICLSLFSSCTTSTQIVESRTPAADLYNLSILLSPVGAEIPSTFFGLHIINSDTPWPTIGFGTERLWDTGTVWSQLEPSQGVFNWANLDQRIALADQKNVRLIYTFGGTPSWASSNPNISFCAALNADPKNCCNYGTGQCAPPSNINDWDEFVRQIVTHANGKIKFWEIWNEPNLPQFYTGILSELLAMAQHAYRIIKSIDPGAQILNPPPTLSTQGEWLSQYFQIGGDAVSDIVSIHLYPMSAPDGGVPIQPIDQVKAVMKRFNQDKKQLWVSEGGWGENSYLPNADAQAAFLAQFYLLQWSHGVSRFNWYAYDYSVYGSPYGTLWNTNLNEAGIAYGEVYKWMVGATLSSPCSHKATGVWSCDFVRPGGYEGQAMWYIPPVSSPATLINITVPQKFVSYRNLLGQKLPIAGPVSLGGMPILLENR
jgi:hypothetical protein